MKDSDKSDLENKTEDTEKSRRDFIKKAGKGAAVAPAVLLLLSANAKADFDLLDPYRGGSISADGD